MPPFYNPPLTGAPGRPPLPQCKRGHDRVPGERACIACRRHRERVKYETNAAFRGRKKTYQSEYRAAFKAEHGYGVHCS